MGKKTFLNPLLKVDAQKDVESTNSSDSDNFDNSYSSGNSDDSDNGKDKDSENVSIQSVRKRQSRELVR